MTLTRHRVRVQPSGHDTLEVRRQYLRKQHSRLGERLRIAAWVVLGAVACFVGTVGLTVLVAGSR